VKADPQHYSVVFENDHVRVLHSTAARTIGAKSTATFSVTVFLTNGNLKMTMPDGRSRTGTVTGRDKRFGKTQASCQNN
jgi:hypothetical protein